MFGVKKWINGREIVRGKCNENPQMTNSPSIALDRTMRDKPHLPGAWFGRARLLRQNKDGGCQNNRQTSYSFVTTEPKIDGQSAEQWNKHNSSVKCGCGDVR